MPITSEVPEYDLGDVIPLGNATWIVGSDPFTDESGAPTNPTSITITVQPPEESGVNPTTYFWPGGTPAAIQQTGNVPGVTPPVAVGPGRFYVNHPLLFSGLWHYRLRGIGAVEQVDEGRFWVKPSTIPL
jgi:hypothetical protein